MAVSDEDMMKFGPLRPAPPADYPVELAEFVDRMKSRGIRTYKGSFKFTDGTEVPVDLAFERERPAKGSSED